MGFNTRPSATSAVRRRRNDVIRYIEDHLRDPTLTAESVADGVHLSPRYMRAIFSESGEKVSDYIRRRRVEECARKMRDPAWAGHSLMKIAFSSGFNSAAHFSRCFRDRFRLSPRDYRLQNPQPVEPWSREPGASQSTPAAIDPRRVVVEE